MKAWLQIITSGKNLEEKLLYNQRHRFKIAVWILALLRRYVNNLKINIADNHGSNSINKNVNPSKTQKVNTKKVSIPVRWRNKQL